MTKPQLPPIENSIDHDLLLTIQAIYQLDHVDDLLTNLFFCNFRTKKTKENQWCHLNSADIFPSHITNITIKKNTTNKNTGCTHQDIWQLIRLIDLHPPLPLPREHKWQETSRKRFTCPASGLTDIPHAIRLQRSEQWPFKSSHPSIQRLKGSRGIYWPFNPSFWLASDSSDWHCPFKSDWWGWNDQPNWPINKGWRLTIQGTFFYLAHCWVEVVFL